MTVDAFERHRTERGMGLGGGDAGAEVARGPGRPKEMDEAARRAVVLDAALGVFGSRGFRATTMDDIARAAGMSKKTIYALFETKTDLFRQILKRSRAGAETPSIACPHAASAEECLVLCLSFMAEVVFSQKEIALMRLVIGESVQTPELAELFDWEILDSGPFGIADYLALAEREGGFTLEDRGAASEMLIGMALGTAHFKTLVADRHRPNAALLRDRIRLAVRIFLAGVRDRCV